MKKILLTLIFAIYVFNCMAQEKTINNTKKFKFELAQSIIIGNNYCIEILKNINNPELRIALANKIDLINSTKGQLNLNKDVLEWIDATLMIFDKVVASSYKTKQEEIAMLNLALSFSSTMGQNYLPKIFCE